MAKKETPALLITNRKAPYEYIFIQRFEAGLQLTGTEVKSVRGGNVNMTEAFCVFEGNELFIKNLHISELKGGGIYNHTPLRKRKLLLTKTELRKIQSGLKEKGVTVVPLKFFNSETGFIKLEIALARGKKSFDKREDIKKRDADREMRREAAE